MSTAFTTFWDPTRLPPLPLHRFSVEEYHRIIKSGVLNENHRVELLEGWIVSKMPHNPPHDSTIDVLIGKLQNMLSADWFPRIQSAITTADSEPEPDIAVVRGPRKRYFEGHPHAADIGLVIEVSDATLHHDRNFKTVVFGRAGIAIYWIVNLADARIEVYTKPFENGYQVRNYGMGELLPVTLDGQEIGTIAVATLFGG
jgi:Uma2 family endonuclease